MIRPAKPGTVEWLREFLAGLPDGMEVRIWDGNPANGVEDCELSTLHGMVVLAPDRRPASGCPNCGWEAGPRR